MKFSIITPSHRQLDWLRLCAASVDSQEGVELEHIVQDTGQAEGIEALKEQIPDIQLHLEQDEGMYDAVDRGIQKSTGDIIAYLNCDEQYLPGALETVRDAFTQAPDIDILCGDVIVVDTEGAFLAYRKVIAPTLWMAEVSPSLPVFTCAMFMRRRVFEEYGVRFDKSWKNIGDAAFVREALKHGVRFGILRQYTSLFTLTGQNLNLDASALPEYERFRKITPSHFRLLRWPLLALYRIHKQCAGCYSENTLTYEAFTLKSPEQRQRFEVLKPTFAYPAVQSQGH